MTRAERASGLGPLRRVWLLSAVLAVGGVALTYALHGQRPIASGLSLPFPLLLVGFACAEAWFIRVRVLRHEQAVAITELPFVLGLAFVAPVWMVVARVVAATAVLAVRTRSFSVKTVFNVTLWLVEAAAAAGVTCLVAGHGAFGPRAWVAVLAGVLAGPAVVSTLGTTAAMGLYEGTLDRREFLSALTQQTVLTLALALPTLVVTIALDARPETVYLLVPTLAMFAYGYRHYLALHKGHTALRGLYTFTHDVSSAYDFDGVLSRVLVQARALLSVPYAEVVLFGGARGEGMRALVRGEELVKLPISVEQDVPADLTGPRPALLRGRSSDETMRQWLSARGIHDALVAPLPGESGPLGLVVVGVPEGGVRALEPRDVDILTSVADQASVALRHADLLQRLRYSSDHDALTGLGNRAVLHREVERMLGDLAAGCLTSVGVFALDLDGFKEINDSFGHAHGDAILTEVAARLVASAPEGSVIARLGGDEFALVAPGLDAEGAQALGAEIRRALEAPVVIGAEEVGVGASVGFAVATAEEGLQTEALLARADLAMYAAKNSDHGPRQWEARLESPGAQKVPLLADLRKAVQDGAVMVWVQPQVDPRDGRLLGVEALARWDHPELGEVPPTTFVAVAERGGLMAQLTAHVLEQSLLLVSGWSRAGLRIPISVNVSPRNVNQHFVADVARLLARYDVDPELVTLELTETSVMLDPERAVAVLAELKTLGLRLSVDDFGTGWSSLAQLQRMTLDELKIDRSFVRDLMHRPSDAAIVRSVLDLGRHLGMTIVAEGVEDAATMTWLAGADCDLVQGYHVARPMPPDALVAWEARRSAADFSDRQQYRKGWAAGIPA